MSCCQFVDQEIDYIVWDILFEQGRFQFLSSFIVFCAIQDMMFDSLRLVTISAETSAPRTPQPVGGAQKGGLVNSQYVVLFTQRMIKVP